MYGSVAKLGQTRRRESSVVVRNSGISGSITRTATANGIASKPAKGRGRNTATLLGSISLRKMSTSKAVMENAAADGLPPCGCSLNRNAAIEAIVK